MTSRVGDHGLVFPEPPWDVEPGCLEHRLAWEAPRVTPSSALQMRGGYTLPASPACSAVWRWDGPELLPEKRGSPQAGR